MLVANSFDLWQKDTFFSAAEEVQQSADIMESAYRTWLRARKEGLIPQHLDELAREVQMALGTAKWQLEEFEKAIQLSYRNHGNDITITRHSHFVSAIEDQISHVETALKESLNVEGKKPFRWVNLDQEECDDLALFLSGTSEMLQRINDEGITNKKNNTKKDSNFGSEVSTKNEITNEEKCLQEVFTSNEDSSYSEISYQTDRINNNRRTWSSPEKNALEIVIERDDREKNALIEETEKEKGLRHFFWSSKTRGVLSHTQLKMIDWMNQHLKGGHRSQRQQQGLPVNSMRFILALLLTIFLVVPFMIYSN